MKSVLSTVFGAHGQLAVGVVVFVLVVAQWVWWGAFSPPTVTVLFHVSMEALALAAYAIIATALGYRATERVEKVVMEGNVDVDLNVGS